MIDKRVPRLCDEEAGRVHMEYEVDMPYTRKEQYARREQYTRRKLVLARQANKMLRLALEICAAAIASDGSLQKVYRLAIETLDTTSEM
jgi:hypothetical protein